MLTANKWTCEQLLEHHKNFFSSFKNTDILYTTLFFQGLIVFFSIYLHVNMQYMTNADQTYKTNVCHPSL